jgi:methylated-DNA-protein-cysteine methyltransferase related protein
MVETFTARVYTIAATIPKGTVATYGQLAKLAGNPKAARAVGMAMSCNTDTKKVPCHRVVSSTGVLTGYAFGGVSKKKALLQKEGITFNKNRVDLAHYQWKP